MARLTLNGHKRQSNGGYKQAQSHFIESKVAPGGDKSERQNTTSADQQAAKKGTPIEASNIASQAGNKPSPASQVSQASQTNQANQQQQQLNGYTQVDGSNGIYHSSVQRQLNGYQHPHAAHLAATHYAANGAQLSPYAIPLGAHPALAASVTSAAANQSARQTQQTNGGVKPTASEQQQLMQHQQQAILAHQLHLPASHPSEQAAQHAYMSQPQQAAAAYYYFYDMPYYYGIIT